MAPKHHRKITNYELQRIADLLNITDKNEREEAIRNLAQEISRCVQVIKQKLRSIASNNVFTREDHETLIYLYYHGYQGNWKEIARLMGNKTPLQVETEWRRLVRRNFNLDEVLENSLSFPLMENFSY